MTDGVTRREFTKVLLARFVAPVTLHTLRFMLTWMQVERSINATGKGAKFNPMNTTKRMPGSTDFNDLGGGIAVQNYPDLLTGVTATAKTLRESGHGYERIIRRLRRNATAPELIDALAISDWGTNAELARKVLDDVRRDMKPYAEALIEQ